jgi:anaerobic magnesium-protoporphyrin IX monomethyl ester cyclase
MRILFVGPNLEYNLSLGYLASSLKFSGHESSLATFDDINDIQNVCNKATDHDMVGLSLCFQIRLFEYMELARQLKLKFPRVPIVIGGHFASCAAKELLLEFSEIDMVVLHEGEHTIVELANLGDQVVELAHTVPGVVTRWDGKIFQSPIRASNSELDSLPFPDRTGPARLMIGVPTTFMMGSRGCYKNCDYCCISTLHKLAPGPKFRQRSIQNIVEEMKYLYQQKGIRQFVFHDDNFLVPSLQQNLKRIDELDGELKKHKLRDIGLVLKCSPSDAHPEVLAKLKEMGLIRIFMGIESGSQEGLNSLGRCQTIGQGKKALETCRDLGISTQYTVIMFNADASLQTMQADLELIREFPNNPMNYCRAEVYAGTPLENRLLTQGRLYGDYKRYKYNYTDPMVQRVWDIAYDLFMGRCWGPDDLLSNMIHLDHQVAVLKHFYKGTEAENIFQSFAPFQEKVNLKTVDLFSELISYVSDYYNSNKLTQKIQSLKIKEYEQRMEFMRIACEYRSRLDSYNDAMVEFTNCKLKSQLIKWDKGLIPRHAAAVLLALGFSSFGVSYGQNDQVQNQQLLDTINTDSINSDVIYYKGIDEYNRFDGIAEAAAPPDWILKVDFELEKIDTNSHLDAIVPSFNTVINSKSSLNVIIDGDFYGTTPLETNISQGKHVILFENKELRIKKKRVIKVKSEGANRFYFNF